MKRLRLLIVLAVCAAFLVPLTAQAAAVPVTGASVQGRFDNGSTVTQEGSNGVALSLSPGIYQRLTRLSTNYEILVTGSAGDMITVTGYILGHVTSVHGSMMVYNDFVDTSSSSVVVNGNEFTLTFQLVSNVNSQSMTVTGSLFVDSYDQSYGLDDARFGWNMSVESQSEGNSLLQRILDFIKSIPDSISNLFSGLTNSLKDWFNNVGDWFSDLGDSIGAWFSDLKTNIQNFFTNLGNSISGFFEKLWNRIYWGNENGESEYQPPTFSSSLDDVLDKIDQYITQLDDTNTEIENAKNESVSYVEQATSVINSLFGVFPSVLIALVVFGVVFIFCRKVVGR